MEWLLFGTSGFNAFIYHLETFFKILVEYKYCDLILFLSVALGFGTLLILSILG